MKKVHDYTWRTEDLPAPIFPGAQYHSSQHLTMRDGVQIAIDLYLPIGCKQHKLPTMLYQTRYFRSVEPRGLLWHVMGKKPMLTSRSAAKRRHFFCKYGFAWVDVDVRGSGASYGTRSCPWSPNEIQDGAEIVDWILTQPWSNGEVGSMGISYSGTTAELLLLNQHPAVKAVVPRFSLFDTYTDIAFPGGVCNHAFLSTWCELNGALDRNDLGAIVGPWVHVGTTGVMPVQNDPNRQLRQEAIAEHKDNYDVFENAKGITFRDDDSPEHPFHPGQQAVREPSDPDGSIGLFSPHNYARHIAEIDVPVFHYSSWLDGAYAHSAIKRFLQLNAPGSRLLLGPWNHGGKWQIEPHHGAKASKFDHDGEMLRFLKQFIQRPKSEKTKDDEPPVRYFTLVAGTWKTAESWPPPATETTYYLSPNQSLTTETPAVQGADMYLVDPTTRTMYGKTSRWKHQAEPDAAVYYPPRIAKDDTKRLSYTTPPLTKDTEITGHPIIKLYVKSSAEDGQFFAYLEDLAPDGKSYYVTEGMLRAIHRKVQPAPDWYPHVVPYRSFKREDAEPLVPGEIHLLHFDLLPVSYLFQAGHRLRLVLTGADADHFPMVPDTPPRLQFVYGPNHPSQLILPVCSREG